MRYLSFFFAPISAHWDVCHLWRCPKSTDITASESCVLMPADALLGTIDRCPVLPTMAVKAADNLYPPWPRFLKDSCLPAHDWQASKGGNTKGSPQRASAYTPWVPPISLWLSPILCLLSYFFFFFLITSTCISFSRGSPMLPETVLLTSVVAGSFPKKLCSQWLEGTVVWITYEFLSSLAPWVGNQSAWIYTVCQSSQ